MYAHRFTCRLALVLAALIWVGGHANALKGAGGAKKSAGVSAASAKKATNPAASAGKADTMGVVAQKANRLITLMQRRSMRVTQAQRKAAALRAAARAAKARTGKVGGVRTTAVDPNDPDPLPLPGGTPRYFSDMNWAFSPALKKFVDRLPLLGPGGANLLGQYLAVAHPDTTTYPGSDYYEISVRQYEEKMHSDLDPTAMRGYVQTNRGTDANTGLNTVEPDPIHYLGPLIVAMRDRAVRIKFTNELATGAGGDLFFPVDPTVMGAGDGPLGPAGGHYKQNRATLHLHGGRSPWISDGTPHQWITPAGETTPYTKGVSVSNVPDMPDPGPGSQTFFYTNQQSARLLFYHDHSWGITRVNVYAGEAAGYLITDTAEQALIATGGPMEGMGVGTPLIIQDKSFVDAATVRTTDPTWNWGTGPIDPVTGYRTPKSGDLWYPHVYVPVQNPYDEGGANPFARWHYGPWFFPPTTNIAFPPVPNPYYGKPSSPNEPPEMPGTPDSSIVGESFFDTSLVNGTVFPYHEVDPKAYRFRVLNAANDRFWNLSLYVADPATVSSDGRTNTEVRSAPSGWPEGFPNFWADPTMSGPDWIQIGNEGGFLPSPAVIPAQYHTWNMNPTTFNFGGGQDHSLLLGPAERADVIVDFSQFAGQTLIVYNDSPAPYPAYTPQYDYFTGAEDMTDTGGHSGPQVGFGPNTRTIMQFRVAAARSDGQPIAPYDIAPLNAAFASTAATPGVFAASQDPIVVGQSQYNTAYNKTFSNVWPLWGLVSVVDTSIKLQTLGDTVMTLPMKPKSIHDEMGAAFDEYGRMAGRLGLELPFTNANNQNFILQNYVDPVTEVLSESPMSPLGPVAGDGTQVWKITHNGVDTHPIHFHLFDVQVINRAPWDGSRRRPDANELGWKETVRIHPLEDTVVALRPITPKQPFGLPDSIRPFNPAMPIGSNEGFSQNNPVNGERLVPPLVNQLGNFGWEYVWHCHILSHEEMDMMRPMVFNVARALPDAPVVTGTYGLGDPIGLTWTDGTPFSTDVATWGNPAGEVGYRVERAPLDGGAFVEIGTALANKTSYTDSTNAPLTAYRYKVIAYNAAGDSPSAAVIVGPIPPSASAVVTPAPNGAGWNNTDATVTITATPVAPATITSIQYSLDGGATWNTYTAPVPVTTEGTTTITYFATDNFTLTSPQQTVTVKLDKTAPALVWGAQAPPVGPTGWNTTAVSIPWTATDALSGGIQPAASGTVNFPNQGASQTQTVTVADLAGNSQAYTSPAVNTDWTPPTIEAEANPATARRRFFPISVRVSGNTTDAISTIDRTSGKFTASSPGRTPYTSTFAIAADGTYQFNVLLAANVARKWTITVTVKDKAGNTNSAITSFTVLP